MTKYIIEIQGIPTTIVESASSIVAYLTIGKMRFQKNIPVGYDSENKKRERVLVHLKDRINVVINRERLKNNVQM